MRLKKQEDGALSRCKGNGSALSCRGRAKSDSSILSQRQADIALGTTPPRETDTSRAKAVGQPSVTIYPGAIRIWPHQISGSSSPMARISTSCRSKGRASNNGMEEPPIRLVAPMWLAVHGAIRADSLELDRSEQGSLHRSANTIPHGCLRLMIGTTSRPDILQPGP